MKNMFFIALSFFSCSMAIAAEGNNRIDMTSGYEQYSCMQLAALNDILLNGASESRSDLQNPNMRLVYIDTNSASQKTSLKAAFLEQAEAAYLMYLNKQCLAD